MNERQIRPFAGQCRVPRRGWGSPGRVFSGFTLIEMMISIAIITLLISLVVVAGSRVRGVALHKQTTQLLVSVKAGLEQFKEIYGYYPPLLNDIDVSHNEFLSVVEDRDDLRDVGYYSTLTLVPYLIGVGDINLNDVPNMDGDGTDDFDDGLAGEGFRDPGRDRSWGGAIDPTNRWAYWERYRDAADDGKLHGKVTKRLVELNETLQRAVDREGNAITDHYLFQLMDVWGTPIRYYAGWDARQTELDVDDGLPLDWPKEWFAGVSAEERESLVSELRSAPFVLLSAGGDRLATPESLDGDEATAEHDVDNIMEIGE